MGGSTSKEEQATSQDAHIFLTKKEYEFIILENEVEEAINTKNREHLRQINTEIRSLYKTLRLLQVETRWNKHADDRCERLLYNYNMILAKVVSFINSPLLIEKEQEDDDDVVVYTDTEENSVSSTVEDNDQQQPIPQTELRNETTENDVEDNKDVINSSEELENVAVDDGPLYENFDDFQDKTSSVNRYKSFKKIKKPPVPIPRNNQDGIVKEIPIYFSRLNDIFEKDVLTEEDVQEVYIIRRRCNEVRDMFVEKADKIFEKYDSQKEENVQGSSSFENSL